MPKIFLSHKRQEKTHVIQVHRYLRSCLLDCWLDKDNLEKGRSLSASLIKEVKERDIFIVFLSEKFMESDWCQEELDIAYQDKDKKIIPVIIGEYEKVKKSATTIAGRVMEKFPCIIFDEYDPEKSCREIAKAVHAGQHVYFKPIKYTEAAGQPIQVIEIVMGREIPTDWLKTWGFNIGEFLARDSEDEENPIKFGMPVVFAGRMVNWLITSLAVPLANNRQIFIYNHFTEEIICAYAKNKKELLGTVIPFKA